MVPRKDQLDRECRSATQSAPNELSMSVIEAYRAVAGFAACIIELLTCVSEFTSENSVTSPARAHAANGKRVFTGRVPTIFNMAILPRCARIPALRLIFPAPKTLTNAT